MTATVEPTIQWSQDQMVEVVLNEPDDFLKVSHFLSSFLSEFVLSGSFRHPLLFNHKYFKRSVLYTD